jgi:hypothetical protein
MGAAQVTLRDEAQEGRTGRLLPPMLPMLVMAPMDAVNVDQRALKKSCRRASAQP